MAFSKTEPCSQSCTQKTEAYNYIVPCFPYIWNWNSRVMIRIISTICSRTGALYNARVCIEQFTWIAAKLQRHELSFSLSHVTMLYLGLEIIFMGFVFLFFFYFSQSLCFINKLISIRLQFMGCHTGYQRVTGITKEEIWPWLLLRWDGFSSNLRLLSLLWFVCLCVKITHLYTAFGKDLVNSRAMRLMYCVWTN